MSYLFLSIVVALEFIVSDAITVFVATATSQQIPVEVPAHAACDDLAAAYAETIGNPQCPFFIKHGGTVLDGGSLLADVGIGPEIVVEVVSEDLSGIANLISRHGFSGEDVDRLLAPLRPMPLWNQNHVTAHVTITGEDWCPPIGLHDQTGVYKTRGTGGVPAYKEVVFGECYRMFANGTALTDWRPIQIREFRCYYSIWLRVQSGLL